MHLDDPTLAIWILRGGLNAMDVDDRHLAHVRALKASRSPSPGIVSRLAAAVAAVRPAAVPADPDCSPA